MTYQNTIMKRETFGNHRAYSQASLYNFTKGLNSQVQSPKKGLS